MEKVFFKEVTILLIPPLFNRINYQNGRFIFLGLGDVIDSQRIIKNLENDEKKDSNSSFLSDEILKNKNFSDSLINSIYKKWENKDSEKAKLVLVNCPINDYQFKSIEEKFESLGIKISKLIISNISSFDTLLDAKSKSFLCPLCFRSYGRDSNFVNGGYNCPFDEENFSTSQINKFTNYFTEYYLKNSLEVIQHFVDRNVDEKNNKSKMIPLNIDSDDKLEEFLKKSLISIIEND